VHPTMPTHRTTVRSVWRDEFELNIFSCNQLHLEAPRHE
jgi:hypothetical protein